MNSLRSLDLAVVAAYFIGMIVIGLRFSRRQKTTESYFVADRAVPAWKNTTPSSATGGRSIGSPVRGFSG